MPLQQIKAPMLQKIRKSKCCYSTGYSRAFECFHSEIIVTQHGRPKQFTDHSANLARAEIPTEATLAKHQTRHQLATSLAF